MSEPWDQFWVEAKNEIAKIISGAPFPSGPSLGKAQQILDFLSDEGLIDRELTEQEHRQALHRWNHE